MKVKKIALVGFRLSGGGGDRVMANLSKFFHKKGLDVHIIIFHDALGYSCSGTIFNLGKLKSNKNSIFNKINRFYHFNKYLKQHQFDFIIDFRFRINFIQEFLISKIIYRTKAIYTVHSYKINEYFPDAPWLANLIYQQSYAIISITNVMHGLIEAKYKFNKVLNIYNPVDVTYIDEAVTEKAPLDFEYIIGVGQFDDNVKQFDKLIQAYADSELPSQNMALVILGKGTLKPTLVNLVNDDKISHLVHFLGFQSNPYVYMKHAKFYVLSSEAEGLPMVVLEALACGTPVVAFDCPTGPKEIIQHESNGLLIDNQNMEALVNGLDRMLMDDALYLNCKRNAKASISKFSLEDVGEQWLDLMKYN